MQADVADCVAVGYSIEYGEARQGGTSATSSARAGDLHALGFGPGPRFLKCIARVRVVGGKPEVGPGNPPACPLDRGRRLAQQIQREVRRWARRKHLLQPSATHISRCWRQLALSHKNCRFPPVWAARGDWGGEGVGV